MGRMYHCKLFCHTKSLHEIETPILFLYLFFVLTIDFDKVYCSNTMTSMVSSEFKFEFYTEHSLHYKGHVEPVNLITLGQILTDL